MSKTKGGGSTRNGRDSQAKRLGVKVTTEPGSPRVPSSCASEAPSSIRATTWAVAGTTPCSPPLTAACRSAPAAGASWWTFSPT